MGRGIHRLTEVSKGIGIHKDGKFYDRGISQWQPSSTGLVRYINI